MLLLAQSIVSMPKRKKRSRIIRVVAVDTRIDKRPTRMQQLLELGFDYPVAKGIIADNLSNDEVANYAKLLDITPTL